MVKNTERRTLLLDAAIEVLAAEGARGLTFRSIDTEAGVPTGTASNYFASRDDLLAQVSNQLYVRFQPTSAELAEARCREPSRELVAELMRRLVHRLVERRTVYLALLELRLEATRRPELRETLTDRVRADLADNVAFHEQTGLPGGRDVVVLLYLALSGMVIEHLTLPGVLATDGELDELVDLVVDRVLPQPEGPTNSQYGPPQGG